MPIDKTSLAAAAMAAAMSLSAPCMTAYTQDLPAGTPKQSLDAAIGLEAAGHTGDHTPMWQVSNRHGLPSIDNYGLVRAAISYDNRLAHNWRLETKVDLAGGIGTDSHFIIQQAYADIYFKWLGLSIGSKEEHFSPLDSDLSSGGLVWSGNARPIPQVKLGAFDYVQICRRFALKAEVSFGWYTDDNYLRETVDKGETYVTGIKYHTKNFYMRIGDPAGHWLWEMGYRLDTQFGGTQHLADGSTVTLGKGLRQYWEALIPQSGSSDANVGEQIAFSGNFLGSELLKLTYQWKGKRVAAYMENYFDDFSGMGKLNGWDGLWGIEYHNTAKSPITGIVVEYYQSTDQSGPLHGSDYDPLCHKTGGADNYYNNYLYQGWTHWGHSMGTPLAVSPMYNSYGTPGFLHNRVKALHLGIKGDITGQWSYRLLMTFSRSWGTYFKPSIDVAENFSLLAEVHYAPEKLRGWTFAASFGADTGDLYGDNAGLQVRVKKEFNILKR